MLLRVSTWFDLIVLKKIRLFLFSFSTHNNYFTIRDYNVCSELIIMLVSGHCVLYK